MNRPVAGQMQGKWPGSVCRYFELYHTANDTLDKVDPEQLRQNLTTWVTLVYLIADSSVESN
jgi:aminopeptidase-like protein